MTHIRRALAVVFGTALLAACDATPPRDPASIDVRPSYPVSYATQRISPAVVRLDVVVERFVRGQAVSDQSIGSGVIIDKEGHILTNFHVAGRAKRLDITLANQEHVRAKLMGSDHWTDLAVVQLDMDEIHRKGLAFQVAELGDSASIALGQPVMAVGTPYGLSRTVTSGIVSNTDRAIDEMTIDGYETGWFNNWIQTDAAINPGNSGGPLINLRGQVVGINTRGINEGNNLAFAIPIDTAKDVVKEILAHGKVSRSYVGVQFKEMQDLEKYYDIPGNKGVLVASVDKNSPAEIAGLKAEDILLAVNGVPVNARFPEQLAAARKLISDFPIGTTLSLTVRRSGAPATTSVAATSTKPVEVSRGESRVVEVTTEKLESYVTEERAVAAWGLSVRNLTRAYLRERRLPPMEGVIVTGTQAGQPADRATIQSGDIIVRVDNKPVTTTQELENAAVEWEKNRQPIGVDVWRGARGQMLLVIKP